MTPKEKAEELIDKLIERVDDISDAKEHALICVDEIINTKALQSRLCGYDKKQEHHAIFWQEVKQEIEKI